MPTILDRPHQIGSELTNRPPQRLLVTGRGRPHRDLTQPASSIIDRDERMSLLVNISTNDNHGGCLLSLISDGRSEPVGGHISVGAKPRSYQVTPAGSFTPADGKTHERHQTRGTHAKSQPTSAKDPTTASNGSNTLTLTAR
jgi:hypothetical protein